MYARMRIPVARLVLTPRNLMLTTKRQHIEMRGCFRSFTYSSQQLITTSHIFLFFTTSLHKGPSPIPWFQITLLLTKHMRFYL